MTCVFLGACCLVAATAVGGTDEIRVSSLGYNPDDSTEIIQNALDSGARRVVFDRQSGPWISRPLNARSNQELVFEEGVTLLAKRGEFKSKFVPLLSVISVTNVTIRGLGKGATFRMWKEDYQDTNQYARAEWRHALRLSGAVNVLVENMTFTRSGGDGICLGATSGIACQNVVIRNCICDDNHRQGISACAFDGLLIENCVLSNTGGTMPQAGIDVEPNNESEPIRNLVMRNVRSFGNAGSGYEIMLHHQTTNSAPVNLLIENCSASNNLNGAVVVSNHVRERNQGRGDVRFVKCSFEENRQRAIRVIGVPKDTLAVRFDDCEVIGSAKSRQTDVAISVCGAMQGHPDHVEFNNLHVEKRNGENWFSFNGPAVGPGPTAVSGTVIVCTTNGICEQIVLDGDWVKENFPIINGGKAAYPMGGIPAFRDVSVVDECPGEMVDLAPVNIGHYGRHYLLCVPKPMTVRFVVNERARNGGPQTKRIRIGRILPDGCPTITNMTLKVGEPNELSFTVRHCPSFYTLEVPSGGAYTCVEKSNVPIALNLTGWTPWLEEKNAKPFSLWFTVPGGKPFMAYAYADPWSTFEATFRDPDGKTFVSGSSVKDGIVLADVSAEQAKPGLWSLEIARSKRNEARTRVHAVTGNLPGYYFLTDRKYWK